MKSDCSWEEIHGFNSLSEYHRFIKWIEGQVDQGVCEEIIEQGKHSGEWGDRWFKCKCSNKIWKLSCPDPGYFSGSWLPV